MKWFVLCWLAVQSGQSAATFDCKPVMDPRDPAVTETLSDVTAKLGPNVEFKMYRFNIRIDGANVEDLDGLQNWKPALRGIPLVGTGPVLLPGPAAGKSQGTP